MSQGSNSYDLRQPRLDNVHELPIVVEHQRGIALRIRNTVHCRRIRWQYRLTSGTPDDSEQIVICSQEPGAARLVE